MTPPKFTLRDFSLHENHLAGYPSLLTQEHNIRLAVRLLADAHPNPTKSDFAKLHIHRNFPFALQSRVNPHTHSQHNTERVIDGSRSLTRFYNSQALLGGFGAEGIGSKIGSIQTVKPADSEDADNLIKMLPLTEVKGNC